jgi:hypothetical protein
MGNVSPLPDISPQDVEVIIDVLEKGGSSPLKSPATATITGSNPLSPGSEAATEWSAIVSLSPEDEANALSPQMRFPDQAASDARRPIKEAQIIQPADPGQDVQAAGSGLFCACAPCRPSAQAVPATVDVVEWSGPHCYRNTF